VQAGSVRKVFQWLAWAGAVFVTVVLLFQLYCFVSIWWWQDHAPSSTAFMRAELSRLRDGPPARPEFQLKHQWVAYPKISVHLKRAVIASEDAKFAEHDGVDWDAIEKAYDANLTKAKVVRGGSTITMQLAKNLFLSGSRSYVRKGQELVITYMLEHVLDKERIFELYLNVAEWGVGVFGAEAAARHHFGVSAAQLNPAQAARLAAMLPAPRFYDQNRGSRRLARKTGMIQRGMRAVELP
jgi:monofunctional glycosyltransferase